MDTETQAITDNKLAYEILSHFSDGIEGLSETNQTGPLKVPFDILISLVAYSMAYDLQHIDDLEAKQKQGLDLVGLDYGLLVEAFIPSHAKKYQSIEGSKVRMRLGFELDDLITLNYAEVFKIVQKSRDIGAKLLTGIMEPAYMRSLGFLPLVKDAGLIKDGVITPDNIESWMPR